MGRSILRAVIRIRVALAVIAMLLSASVVAAHDIPASVVVQAFVRPQGNTLRLLVRVPLGAMRDVELPLRTDGTLDIGKAGEAARNAALLWLARDIEVYEKTAFIRGVENGMVRFEYRGRHKALFQNIPVGHVRWVCERLNRLSDRQWTDAFRAGGIEGEMAERFIRRTKQKIAEGLALKG